MSQRHSVPDILAEILAVPTDLLGYTSHSPDHPLQASSSIHVEIPHLPSPASLTPQLTELGLSHFTADRMSQVYSRNAEVFRTAAENTLRSAITKLAVIPRHDDAISFEKLRQLLLDAHLRRYNSTLENWAEETMTVARDRLAVAKGALSVTVVPDGETTRPLRKGSKRKFKSEYLPLFEFAFSKDRFPNREDKKHLAKISGMSYRQICVWFQNRRCRHDTRVKSHHLTPPPQTFEEMKERLSVSAREALSRAPSALKETPRLPPPNASNSIISAAQDVTGSQVLVCGLKDEKIASTQFRARSLGISEVSDSEERDELEVDDDMPTLASSYSPELELRPLNPLNPHKPTTANAFPAVYKPSKLTINPFVVEPQTWLRSTQAPGTTQFVDPTPEVLESIMEGFDKMDVDVPMSDSDPSLGSLTTHKDPVPRTPPHTNALSLRTPPHSHTSMLRTSSSGSSVSWSSDASTLSSRSASYSTAPSSVLSSPNHSEICLPNQSECETAPLTLTAPSPTVDEESTCHTPVDEVASRAGPFDVSSIKPATKLRVDEWMSGVSTQPEDDHAANKWQQLLAAAAAEVSPAA